MSQKQKSKGISKWPQWTIIPLGLGFAMLAIVLGLLLESAAVQLH